MGKFLVVFQKNYIIGRTKWENMISGRQTFLVISYTMGHSDTGMC